MLCNACNQDRHPVIEGDQNGRFQYTCGNGECHAFIKLHERSEPKAATPAQPTTIPAGITPSVFVPAAPIAITTTTNAVASLVARLLEVETLLSAVPELKAERARLRRGVAAIQAKPRAPRLEPTAQSLMFDEAKVHQ